MRTSGLIFCSSARYRDVDVPAGDLPQRALVVAASAAAAQDEGLGTVLREVRPERRVLVIKME